MALIRWSDEEYSVGINIIDKQHKILVDLINRLSEAINKEATASLISSLFHELTEYTKFHFKAEEVYFSTLNEIDSQLHQLQHKHFVEQLMVFNEQHEQACFSYTDLLYFLSDWLIIHIQCEDRKFIEKNLN